MPKRQFLRLVCIPFHHSGLHTIVRPHAVTVGAHYFTLLKLTQCLRETRGVAGATRNIEDFLCAIEMVEVHGWVRKAAMAIGARDILLFPNHVTNASCVLVVLVVVILPVSSVVVATVGCVTLPAPGLTNAFSLRLEAEPIFWLLDTALSTTLHVLIIDTVNHEIERP